MNSLRSRWFIKDLESALRVLPVTVVTGARQTGKTTLATKWTSSSNRTDNWWRWKSSPAVP